MECTREGFGPGVRLKRVTLRETDIRAASKGKVDTGSHFDMANR